MADIDFDELDKAVSSLMSDASRPALKQAAAPQPETTTENDEKPVEVDKADDEVAVNVQQTAQDQTAEPLTDEANETEEVTLVPQPVEASAQSREPAKGEPEQKSLATKRRGQFMDMKHPSANMKSSPAPVKAAHTAITIEPPSKLEPELTPELTPEEKTEPQETEKSADTLPDVPEVEITSATPQDAPQTSEKPVPAPEPEPAEEQVEVEAKEEVVVEPKEEVTADEQPAPEPTSEETPTDEQAAQASPFIADAKVEKRPLGAPAPLAEAAISPEPSGESEIEVEVAEGAGGLPDELHESVLAVEADTTTNGSSANKKDETTDASVAPTTDDKPENQASIPNQYKPSESKADESSTAETSLYDSAGEHDAFAASPKRSHWSVVLGIIIIIVLGAAIGAGLYVVQAGLI